MVRRGIGPAWALALVVGTACACSLRLPAGPRASGAGPDDARAEDGDDAASPDAPDSSRGDGGPPDALDAGAPSDGEAGAPDADRDPCVARPEVCGDCEDEDCDGRAEPCDGSALAPASVEPEVGHALVFAGSSRACYACVELECADLAGGPAARLAPSIESCGEDGRGGSWRFPAFAFGSPGEWRCSLVGREPGAACGAAGSPRVCVRLVVR